MCAKSIIALITSLRCRNTLVALKLLAASFKESWKKPSEGRMGNRRTKKRVGFGFEYTGKEQFNDRSGPLRHLGTFMSRFRLHLTMLI